MKIIASLAATAAVGFILMAGATAPAHAAGCVYVAVNLEGRVLDVNILGCVHGIRAALPILKRQGSGVIINVSSSGALMPLPRVVPYSGAKAALNAVRKLQASGGLVDFSGAEFSGSS